MPLTVAPIAALTGLLPVGRSTFGPITPTAGVTAVQVAVSRTDLLLLTKQLDWALELSTDAGVSWLPWGGAGTLAGSSLNSLGNVPSESSFIVPIPTADANTRLR